jgi:asparagine synthetase A
VKKDFDLRTQEVELPELNTFMELSDGQIASMIVRQMTFEEVMKSQQDNFDMMRNLIEGIVEASTSKIAVKEEVEDFLDKSVSPVTRQRMQTIENCLVDPKLSYTEVNYICKMFPTVGTKLYSVIIDLTNKGADLKKNTIE